MALLDEIHSIINFATDKGVTGYHRPEDIDNEIHAVSMDMWQKFMDQYAITKKMNNYMSPFEVIDEDIALTSGAGVLTKEIELATLSMVDGKEAKELERYQWGKAMSDAIAPPTATYPVILFGEKGEDNLYNIEILPTTASTATIYGIRKPKKPNWTYTIGADGRRVFDESNNDFQEIEWSELLNNDIRNRVLSVMGINLREPQVASFAQTLKAEGE